MDSQELDEILWRHLSSLPYFRGFLRAIEDRFFQEITIEAPVLDLGSGDGHFAAAAFKEKLDVGMDPWVAPTLEAPQASLPPLVLAEEWSHPVLKPILQHGDECICYGTYSGVGTCAGRSDAGVNSGEGLVLCSQSPFSPSPERAKIPDENRLTTSGQGLQSLFNRIAPCAYGRSEIWKERLTRAGFVLEQSWDYFPPDALRVLEWGTPGTAVLFSKKLFGR